MVARDGIEPLTPAFSERLTDNFKRFRISGTLSGAIAYGKSIWDGVG
jgi:hypothetical protein